MTTTHEMFNLTMKESLRHHLIGEIDRVSLIVERLTLTLANEIAAPLYPVTTRQDLAEAYSKAMSLLARLMRQAEELTY